MPEQNQKAAFTPEQSAACVSLIYAKAQKYNIPPVWLTAHVRYMVADLARREAMVAMIAELKLRRWQVAAIFGRDLRRVRKSVLGI